MGSTEKFCLRWNDFESNISLAFRDIREEKDFFDCTLSCGSRQLQAHKLILSACSPFFRSILKQNPHQHPLLYLKGVEFTDLQAVLNFMYHGEVNVAQEELNSFLAVAEDLQVKGLTQNNSKPMSPSPPPPSYSKPRPKEPDPPAPPKRPRSVCPPQPVAQPSYQQPDDDDILEVLPTVKTEPVAPTIPYPAPVSTPTRGMETMASMGMQVTSMDESYGDDGYDYGGYEGDGGQGYEEMTGLDPGIVDQSKDVVVDYAVRQDGGKYSCKLCAYTARDKYNVRIHLERKHGLSAGYQCDLCLTWVQNKQRLSQHRVQCVKNNSSFA
jgi:hypothetical protein